MFFFNFFKLTLTMQLTWGKRNQLVECKALPDEASGSWLSPPTSLETQASNMGLLPPLLFLEGACYRNIIKNSIGILPFYHARFFFKLILFNHAVLFCLILCFIAQNQKKRTYRENRLCLGFMPKWKGQLVIDMNIL